MYRFELFTLMLLVVQAMDDMEYDCPLDPSSPLDSGHCVCTPNYDFTSREIECYNLDNIPTFVADGHTYHYVAMTKQSIHEIPEGAFRALGDVSIIALSSNPIGQNIHPRAFSGLEDSLDSVHLINCGVTQLPSGLFNGMKKLHTIYMSLNNITHIPDDYFVGTVSPHLSVLTLQYNEISDLNGHSLAGLSLLYALDLSHNKIRSITPDILRHNFRRLNTLLLGHNNIDRIIGETFIETRNLEKLSLDNNDINVVYDNAFKGLYKLQYLHLQNNNIEFLGSMLFADLERLSVLHLSHNSITELGRNDFRGLGMLVHLYVDHNELEAIGPEVFSECNNLRTLSLGDNNIETISQCSLPRDGKLEYLFLGNNNLFCDCRLYWMTENDIEDPSYIFMVGTRCAGSDSYADYPGTYEGLGCSSTSIACE